MKLVAEWLSRAASGGLTIVGMTLLFCLCGCAVTPPYPSQLPALAPAEKKMGVCPAIAGRYADKGSAFSKEGKPLGQVSLTGLLHGHDRSSSSWLTNANVVVVLGPTNRLLGFQSWSDDKLLGKRVWQELRPFRWGGELGDRYCGFRGFVWLRLEWTGSVSVVGFGGGQSNESLWLR